MDLMEYNELQPFGEERANWHAAIIAQILAAAHTSSKRTPPTVRDFMFKDAQTRHDEQEQETLNWLRAMKSGN